MVGSSTGVQAGKKSLGLLLHTCRGRHGQEECGQLQCCSLILLLQKDNKTCQWQDKEVLHWIFHSKMVLLLKTSKNKSWSVYLFIGGTYCKTTFQGLERADHQPEIKKQYQHWCFCRFYLKLTKHTKTKSQRVAVCAILNAKTTLNARINAVRGKVFFSFFPLFSLYKHGDGAWHVHSCRHGHTNCHTCTKPYKQAEKGQLLTGPRLIRTQFHNFLLCFWEQKKKNK